MGVGKVSVLFQCMLIRSYCFLNASLFLSESAEAIVKPRPATESNGAPDVGFGFVIVAKFHQS